MIGGKKWTEVSAPFLFPPSFTSKSFTLRKMYSRLLHDYEQVYFHHNAGPPTPPPGALRFCRLCQTLPAVCGRSELPYAVLPAVACAQDLAPGLILRCQPVGKEERKMSQMRILVAEER